LLSPATASVDDLNGYLDHFFKAVVPGNRLIMSVADTTPPNADFDRLVLVGERIAKEGRLQLQAGAARPLTAASLKAAADRTAAKPLPDEVFQAV
ncbi:hypothetical protein P6O77_15600, partial [Clostridium perfringens]|nr:hypothetical protein [Clostridium perfringens]